MNGFGPVHHAGIAVADVGVAADFYARVFGAVLEPGEFDDPAQGVRIRFVQLGGLRLELLQPLDSASHLNRLVRRGINLYHICYETDDLNARLAQLRAEGVHIISPPKPAVAFNNRRVAFTMYQGFMIEFLEATKP